MYVVRYAACGIERAGVNKPLSRSMQTTKNHITKMACCMVSLWLEMTSPKLLQKSASSIAKTKTSQSGP